MKKNKTAKKTKKPKKANNAVKSTATKPKSADKKPEEIMDRATLKGIANQLKGAGSSVKVLKSDTDEALQKKVNEALRELPSTEVLKTLESIDPNKLINVLKQDCLGIFVDFSDVSCVRCPDAERCVTKFIGNLKNGMTAFKGAMATIDEDDKKEKKDKAPPAKMTAVTRYEEGRLIFIRDVPNPNPKGDDLHETIERILDEQPETLGELRTIVEEDFDLEGDADFMKFVTALRDPTEGVIRLDVDLSEKNKVALREAGYEV